MVPLWLHLLSWLSLASAAVFAFVILADEFKRPQPMWIMNVVWPVTALFGGLLWFLLYRRIGRTRAPGSKPSLAVAAAKAASHCGAGCTLGDIAAEILALAFPGVAVALGWHSLFGERVFAIWVLDFILAYLIGIIFQYFTIAPMRHLGPLAGVWAALKADTLSLVAWQVGMYGFMAVAQFGIFRSGFHVQLDAAMPEFWFMMQIAMLCGFAVSFPVNMLLVRTGLKERM